MEQDTDDEGVSPSSSAVAAAASKNFQTFFQPRSEFSDFLMLIGYLVSFNISNCQATKVNVAPSH